MRGVCVMCVCFLFLRSEHVCVFVALCDVGMLMFFFFFYGLCFFVVVFFCLLGTKCSFSVLCCNCFR